MAIEKEKTVKTYGFDKALQHMKDGMPAVRIEWQREKILRCRILDTGLGNTNEFTRQDEQNRSTRYQMSSEDIMATDWRLL